jgi:CRP-like cAMP-binding protein
MPLAKSGSRRYLIVALDGQLAAKLNRVCLNIGIETDVCNDPARVLSRESSWPWDGAILVMACEDGRLHVEVADMLSRRRLPFIFVVSAHGDGIPPRHERVPRLVRPVQRERLVHLVTTYIDAAPTKNKENPVLAALLAENGSLGGDLAPFALQVRQTVSRPGRPLNNVIFVESGMCAIIGKLGANEVEIGQIGNEGVVGGWIATDVATPPFRVTVQIEGMAAALPVHSLLRAMDESPTIRAILIRHQHHLHMQFAAAATANATLRVENRLARWLVMCSDRIGTVIPVVHADLSAILNVRRPGVTAALRQMERACLIAPKRGLVRILDRERLVLLSNGADVWTGS